MPGDREWLETMQSLLVSGWFLLAAWFAGTLFMDWYQARRTPKRTPYELCKLHSRPTSECHEMHDKESKE